MKHLFLASMFLPIVLSAQLPVAPPGAQRIRVTPQQTETLPDNYQLTLVITDKDGPPVEVSVVVASTQFQATVGEQDLTFSGSVAVEENGAVVVSYALGWQTAIPNGNSVQYKTSGTQGSARLKPGEEIQVFRAGSRTARLSIKKLEEAKPK